MHYLAQVSIGGDAISALKDAGVTGYLLVGFILGAAVLSIIYLLIRNWGKKTGSDAAIMTALTNIVASLATNITKLTDNELEMQTGSRERDKQMNLMIQSTKEQNERLDGIKNELTTGNKFTKDLYQATLDNTTDTHAVFDSLTTHVTGTEANILAHIDTQAQRIVNNATESHSNLKQFISERTKSIEDLFGKITSENEDLVAKVELRDDTIASLQSQLTTANEKLRLYEHPEPPTPVLVVNGTTGETEKQEAK